MPPRPSPLLGLGHPQDLFARHRPDLVWMVALDVLLDVRDQLVVALAADGLTARAVDFLGHGVLLVAELRMLRRAGETVERLLGGRLLGGFLRPARAHAGLLA